MAKSDKMYKDTPSIKKDGDGKAAIKKPSDADKENMGLSGSPLPDSGSNDGMPIQVGEMHDRHQKEMKDTHKRHEEEIKDMHKRHMKEHSKVASEGKTGESEESHVEGTK